MDDQAEVRRLRAQVGRLRLSRAVLFRLLEDALRAQQALEKEVRRLRGLSNVRHLLPRSAQERTGRP